MGDEDSLESVVDYLGCVKLHSTVEDGVSHRCGLSKHWRLLAHLSEGQDDVLPLRSLQDGSDLWGEEVIRKSEQDEAGGGESVAGPYLHNTQTKSELWGLFAP